jgi:signal transduction histidine kinase
MLVAAGSVGVVCAMVLGHRVALGARSLGDLAWRIGEGHTATAPTSRSVGELGDLELALHEMQAKLDESRRRELASEHSRRELVTWVSHDLRTPLAGLRAVVEALEDGIVSDPATRARHLATMRTEVERLTGLVGDLFELSRIQSGTLRLDKERVVLTDLVSDALAAAHEVAEAKGVHLHGTFTDSAPEADVATAEVLRVLHNLLENAIRHTPVGGGVSLDLSDDGDDVLVAVADSCGGIAEDELARVFETAFSGDGARSPGDGRAGLGLAIATGIVAAHGGGIEVANEIDGCCFTVRLPRAG